MAFWNPVKAGIPLFLSAAFLAVSAPAAEVRGTTETSRSYALFQWESALSSKSAAGLSSVEDRVPGHLPVPDRQIEDGEQGAPVSSPRAAPQALARPTALLERASFAALGDDGTVVVPDVMGAVSSSHLMVTLNTQVAVQNRIGTTLSVVSLPAFWAGVGTAPFDPKIVFDEDSQRFIFVAMDEKRVAASAVLVGVSATSDPTGAWHLRKFDADPADVVWADYPNLAVNKNWIVITGNMFSVAADTFQGSKMWVLEKSAAILPGGVAPTVFATGFDNTGLGGGDSITGAVTYGPEETLYLVDNRWVGGGGRRFVRVSRITGPPAAPSWSLVPGGTVSGGGFVQVSGYGGVLPAPQSGSAQTLDARDARIINAVFRNGTLWYTHTGGQPAAAPTRNAVHWYQLSPAASLTLVQQGIIDDPSGGMHYFFPSIAVGRSDDVLLGFAGSSAARFAGAYYAGRSGRDPPGTMQAVKELKAGQAGYFKVDVRGANRWGDYTATVPDPLEDGTFWTLQQYAAVPDGQDKWGTWWGRISLSHDLPPALASMKTFPVPWTPGSGDRFDSADHPGCGRGLIFEDISGEATIRIYTVLGELVRTLAVSTADRGCVSWDGRNISSADVASGVYLAVIKNLGGEKIVKRLIVQR